MSAASKIWDKTAGYKTRSGAALLVIYQLVKTIFPDFFSGTPDEITRGVIDLIIITGVLDHVWQNRKLIFTI
jgi:hypothetical protein